MRGTRPLTPPYISMSMRFIKRMDRRGPVIISPASEPADRTLKSRPADYSHLDLRHPRCGCNIKVQRKEVKNTTSLSVTMLLIERHVSTYSEAIIRFNLLCCDFLTLYLYGYSHFSWSYFSSLGKFWPLRGN
jgi:hypothetical protein